MRDGQRSCDINLQFENISAMFASSYVSLTSDRILLFYSELYSVTIVSIHSDMLLARLLPIYCVAPTVMTQ